MQLGRVAERANQPNSNVSYSVAPATPGRVKRSFKKLRLEKENGGGGAGTDITFWHPSQLHDSGKGR